MPAIGGLMMWVEGIGGRTARHRPRPPRRGAGARTRTRRRGRTGDATDAGSRDGPGAARTTMVPAPPLGAGSCSPVSIPTGRERVVHVSVGVAKPHPALPRALDVADDLAIHDDVEQMLAGSGHQPNSRSRASRPTGSTASLIVAPCRPDGRAGFRVSVTSSAAATRITPRRPA